MTLWFVDIVDRDTGGVVAGANDFSLIGGSYILAVFSFNGGWWSSNAQYDFGGPQAMPNKNWNLQFRMHGPLGDVYSTKDWSISLASPLPPPPPQDGVSGDGNTLAIVGLGAIGLITVAAVAISHRKNRRGRGRRRV